MKITSTGLNEILKNIDKLGKDANKIGERAVKRVAEDVVKEALIENTPYDSDSTNPSHLRDNVVVRMKRTKDKGYRLAYVTYSRTGKGKDDPRDVLWRAHFVEWGTVSQRPQGMIIKTVGQTKSKVEREIERELRRLI